MHKLNVLLSQSFANLVSKYDLIDQVKSHSNSLSCMDPGWLRYVGKKMEFTKKQRKEAKEIHYYLITRIIIWKY